MLAPALGATQRAGGKCTRGRPRALLSHLTQLSPEAFPTRAERPRDRARPRPQVSLMWTGLPVENGWEAAERARTLGRIDGPAGWCHSPCPEVVHAGSWVTEKPRDGETG